MLQSIRSRQGKFTNLESPIDGSLHGLGTCFGCGSAQDGTCADFCEFLEDGVVGFFGLHAVEAGGEGACGTGGDSGA